MATAAATRFTAAGAVHGFRGRTSPWTHCAFFPNRRAADPLRCRRHFLVPAALHKPDFQIKEEGQPETLDYRIFFLDVSGKNISPWHDVPLHLGDGVFNFIVEIPKNTSAKMEVATDESYTPIKQDTKKGKLRYYPYNINWNYGLLPQTWEDPSCANSEVEGALGDNDPVDVVEIGETQAKMGDILKVKPLAALAMIDEGELDWKIVAISLDDPRALLVNDVNDVEKHFPGTLMAIRDWFRDYKIPDGKPANKFGLGNKAANKDPTGTTIFGGRLPCLRTGRLKTLDPRRVSLPGRILKSGVENLHRVHQTLSGSHRYYDLWRTTSLPSDRKIENPRSEKSFSSRPHPQEWSGEPSSSVSDVV